MRYRRLPARICAYASICFMALILHRVMRMPMCTGNIAITPERAPQALKRIQHHHVSLNGAPPQCGVLAMSAGQHEVLKS